MYIFNRYLCFDRHIVLSLGVLLISLWPFLPPPLHWLHHDIRDCYCISLLSACFSGAGFQACAGCTFLMHGCVRPCACIAQTNLVPLPAWGGRLHSFRGFHGHVLWTRGDGLRYKGTREVVSGEVWFGRPQSPAIPFAGDCRCLHALPCWAGVSKMERYSTVSVRCYGKEVGFGETTILLLIEGVSSKFKACLICMLATLRAQCNLFIDVSLLIYIGWNKLVFIFELCYTYTREFGFQYECCFVRNNDIQLIFI